MPHNLSWLTAERLWEILVHVVPIVITIVYATIKIGKMIKDEMEKHGTSMLTAVKEVEERLVGRIEAIWKDQGDQNRRISEVEKGHYRLEGRIQGLGHRVGERPPAEESSP